MRERIRQLGGDLEIGPQRIGGGMTPRFAFLDVMRWCNSCRELASDCSERQRTIGVAVRERDGEFRRC